MTIKQVLDGWRTLSLHDQIEVAKTILAEIGAVRHERAIQAQGDLRDLGGEHEHHSTSPEGASKYRSMRDASQTWDGIGDVPRWLLDEMEAGEKPLDNFKVR